MSFPSPEDLKGTVQGTLLYLGLYFGVFIPFQSFSKYYLVAQKRKEAREKDGSERISFRALKYYNSNDQLALTGDRTVGNFIEFAVLFLPLYWMHALFVDASKSLTISIIYTISRLLYPFLFNQGWMLVLSTFPGYMICLYLMYKVTFEFAIV